MSLTALPADLLVATGRDSRRIPSTSFCGQCWMSYSKGRLPSSSRHAHTLSSSSDNLAAADACDLDTAAPWRTFRGRRTEDDALQARSSPAVNAVELSRSKVLQTRRATTAPEHL